MDGVQCHMKRSAGHSIAGCRPALRVGTEVSIQRMGPLRSNKGRTPPMSVSMRLAGHLAVVLKLADPSLASPPSSPQGVRRRRCAPLQPLHLQAPLCACRRSAAVARPHPVAAGASVDPAVHHTSHTAAGGSQAQVSLRLPVGTQGCLCTPNILPLSHSPLTLPPPPPQTPNTQPQNILDRLSSSLADYRTHKAAVEPFLRAFAAANGGRRPAPADARAAGDAALAARFQQYQAARRTLMAEIPRLRQEYEEAVELDAAARSRGRGRGGRGGVTNANAAAAKTPSEAARQWATAVEYRRAAGVRGEAVAAAAAEAAEQLSGLSIVGVVAAAPAAHSIGSDGLQQQEQAQQGDAAEKGQRLADKAAGMQDGDPAGRMRSAALAALQYKSGPSQGGSGGGNRGSGGAVSAVLQADVPPPPKDGEPAVIGVVEAARFNAYIGRKARQLDSDVSLGVVMGDMQPTTTTISSSSPASSSIASAPAPTAAAPVPASSAGPGSSSGSSSGEQQQLGRLADKAYVSDGGPAGRMRAAALAALQYQQPGAPAGGGGARAGGAVSAVLQAPVPPPPKDGEPAVIGVVEAARFDAYSGRKARQLDADVALDVVMGGDVRRTAAGSSAASNGRSSSAGSGGGGSSSSGSGSQPAAEPPCSTIPPGATPAGVAV
jgi:hypothetical protein